MKIGNGIKDIGINDICFRCPEKNTCSDLETMKEMPVVKILFVIICNKKGGSNE